MFHNAIVAIAAVLLAGPQAAAGSEIPIRFNTNFEGGSLGKIEVAG